MKNKKAIIIGASSGIGREVAVQLSNKGYELGLTARRTMLLKELQSELPGKSHVATMDISNPLQSRTILSKLIEKMGYVDVIIINAGIGIRNPSWMNEIEIVQTNVQGFIALANLAFEHFKKQRGGTLAAVSSIAGIRGSRIATAYSASKAFMSNYMEGLRFRSRHEKLNITVMDIIPGFVETSMTKGLGYKFWVSKPHNAAKQIIKSLKNHQSKAYVTRKWILVAYLMKYAPDWIHSLI